MHIKTDALGRDGDIHMPSYMKHGYNNLISWQYLACGVYVRIEGVVLRCLSSYRKRLELSPFGELERSSHGEFKLTVANVHAKSYSSKKQRGGKVI